MGVSILFKSEKVIIDDIRELGKNSLKKIEFRCYEEALIAFRKSKEKDGKYIIRKAYELDKEDYSDLYRKLWAEYSPLVEGKLSEQHKKQYNQDEKKQLVELRANIIGAKKKLEKVSGEYKISIVKRLQCLEQTYSVGCECQKALDALRKFYDINKCLMQYLAYFAGCSSLDAYHLLSSHIHNDTRYVVTTLQRNSDSLHNLEQQLQAFEEQYREWDTLTRDVEDLEHSSFYEYEEQMKDIMEKISKCESEIVDTYNCNAEENYEELQENVDDTVKIADDIYKKMKDKLPAFVAEIRIEKEEELKRKCKKYETELSRLALANREDMKRLIYLKLLVKALPLLWRLEEEEIDNCDYFTAEACWEEYREHVYQLLEEFNKETQDAYFEWVDAPQEVKSIADEKRHLYYKVSDAAWPCLFVDFRDGNEPVPISLGGRLD